jgi:hypothetical protein
LDFFLPFSGIVFVSCFCFIARPSSTCDMYARYNKQYTINGSVDMCKGSLGGDVGSEKSVVFRIKITCESLEV